MTVYTIIIYIFTSTTNKILNKLFYKVGLIRSYIFKLQLFLNIIINYYSERK